LRSTFTRRGRKGREREGKYGCGWKMTEGKKVEEEGEGREGARGKGVKIWLFPLLWLVAFTTACTTVQAVTTNKK